VSQAATSACKELEDISASGRATCGICAGYPDLDEKTNGFKKGGAAAKKMAGGYAKGGMSKKVMSCAEEGERPARKSGGGVFSSASSGTPRGKASHY
jgi:hypothetical protein